MSEIKRLNYFTSQFLVEKDFKDEQAYHIGMRRLHNQALHSWGVAQGLLVTKNGEKQLVISPGLAIDNNGREIVLPSDPAPEAIDLTSLGVNVKVILAIAYQDFLDKADLYQVGAVNNSTRITERPRIIIFGAPEAKVISEKLEFKTDKAPDDGSMINLAEILIDASGKIVSINTNIRALASSRIPPGAKLPGPLTIDTNLNVAGNLDIGGNLKVTGNLIVPLAMNGGNWDLTNTEGDLKIGNNTHRLKVGVSLGGGGAGDVRIRSQGGSNRLIFGSGTSDVLTIQNGNVGIGTITPSTGLEINQTDSNKLALLLNSSGSGWSSGIQFKNTAPNAKTYGIYSGSDGNFHFADGNNNVDRLIINKDGLCGFGTTEPGEKIHVEGGNIRIRQFPTNDTTPSLTSLQLINRGSGGNNVTWTLYTAAVGGGFGVNPNAFEIWEYPATLTRFQIRQGGNTNLVPSGGNVGIGTVNPQAKLDVEGDAMLGYEGNITNFGTPLKSGFYQNGGQKRPGDVPDNSHGWTHLITARHYNLANNHQLQIAASFGINDRLFFRKIAADLVVSNPTWNEVATRSTNTFTGNQTFSGSLYFGAQVRQMLNLWNENYGIGVQAYTLYFRTDTEFAWHKGGVHNDNAGNPGGGARLMALNGAGDLILSARTNPSANPNGSACRALVDGDRKLIINFGGDYSSGVEIFNGKFTSSREVKENITDLATEEATEALKNLNPVKFKYKTEEEGNLHLGFIAEDVPDLLASEDRKSIGSLDIVAVLTKVVQDQQKMISELAEKVKVLEQELGNTN